MQTGAAPQVRGRGVEDAEVEQHPVRGADHGAVGGPDGGFAIGLAASVQRRGQVVQVRGVPLCQRATGLDEEPDDNAFGDAAHGVRAVIELVRRGDCEGGLSGKGEAFEIFYFARETDP